MSTRTRTQKQTRAGQKGSAGQTHGGAMENEQQLAGQGTSEASSQQGPSTNETPITDTGETRRRNPNRPATGTRTRTRSKSSNAGPSMGSSYDQLGTLIEHGLRFAKACILPSQSQQAARANFLKIAGSMFSAAWNDQNT